MPIITLTSDLGTADHYVAAIKGAILKQLPDVTIVDISHDIPKYDLLKASFVIKNVWREFPEGSIHIIGMLPESTDQVEHVIVSHEGHFFIGADNGIFSLLFNPDFPDRWAGLSIQSTPGMETFATKDIFVKAACHIARGGTMEVISRNYASLRPAVLGEPITSTDFIRAQAIYIDSYGNIITNVRKEVFLQIAKNRPFEITFRKPSFRAKKISKRYSDVDEGDIVALFGETDLLEIAMRGANASQLLSVKANEIISIEFNDH